MVNKKEFARLNKGGFIKIIEAVLGVLIIVSALLIVVIQRQDAVGGGLDETLPRLLDDVARDNSFRKEIVYDSDDDATTENKIIDYLSGRLGDRYEIRVVICDFDELCNVDIDAGTREVYSAERLITTLSYEPYG